MSADGADPFNTASSKLSFGAFEMERGGGAVSCEAVLYYSVSAGRGKVGQGDTGEPVRSYTWKIDQQADTVPPSQAKCDHTKEEVAMWTHIHTLTLTHS